MTKDKIIIYTDGAAKGNPGRAGWAAVILRKQNNGGQGRVHEIGRYIKHATNNQMELTAPIEALKYLKRKNTQATPVYNIEIVSDSKYVILGITEWIENWMKNNWRNAAKKPVLNRKLWEELYELTREFKIKWIYVKGHNENKYNERADEIATSFAEEEPVELKKYK
ncbi:ribonuclease HI [Candidatus Nomurabacteria bacterium RIFCSPHIGHO2_01_FULL_43_16]|nr:MAG: ribonuclease HI [Candidatus Nomurabacteria bacterium RIFCSPHIGHO2_01_FULL_43_16]